MGMNPRGRSRGRNHSNNYVSNSNNNSNNRRFNTNNPNPSRNTVLDSSGPVGRLRGTALQLMEKYQNAAKEVMSSDRVLAESCLQHADHFMRLNLMAVACENRFNPQHQSQPETSPQPETSAQPQEESVASSEQPVVSETPQKREHFERRDHRPVRQERSERPQRTERNDRADRNTRPTQRTDSSQESKLDLSLPMFALTDQLITPLLTGATVPEVSDETVVVPKRRGRPPRKPVEV